MSQSANLIAAFQAIGADINDLLSNVGDLTSLTTIDKSNLVAALNEIKLQMESAGVGVQINDTVASTGTVYSSTKTEAVATDKANTAANGLINDTTASGTKVYSSTKTQAVANAAAAAIVDDAAPSLLKTFSSSKINAQIDAAIAAIIDGAPGAFDTLKELADYVESDQTAVAAMTASINNRVRYDAPQSLTTAQQIQASTNIGVGDITTDFVAAYVTAKA